jgi:hypothetical protein
MSRTTSFPEDHCPSREAALAPDRRQGECLDGSGRVASDSTPALLVREQRVVGSTAFRASCRRLILDIELGRLRKVLHELDKEPGPAQRRDWASPSRVGPPASVRPRRLLAPGRTHGRAMRTSKPHGTGEVAS